MNNVCSSSLDIEQILNDSSNVLSSSDDIGELIQVFNSKQSNRYYNNNNSSYSNGNSYNEGDNTRSINAAKTGRVLPNEREKTTTQTNNTIITMSTATKSTRAIEAVKVETTIERAGDAFQQRREEEREEEEGEEQQDSDNSNISQDSNNNLDSPLLQLSSLSEDDTR